MRELVFVLTVFLNLFADQVVVANPNGRIITLPQGRIRGRYSETRGGRFFVEYFGIPYAQPAKRFKNPRWPPKKHEWIKDCTRRAPPCFQMRGATPIGDENCLTLNVHTAATHQNYWLLKNMPVLVVFHGGSWMVDRGDWNGGEGDQLGAKHFMDEDCVIVTANYRLGVFGFFTLFNEIGPANIGLKDQVMVLRWVKEYISYFGGDPNLVTIVGQGAGAASVGLHLFSPLSKGLFHRAIMQSGSPLCHWALVDDKQMASLSNYLDAAGCKGAVADQNAIDCLTEKTPEELEAARQKIMTVYDDPFHPFGPVIEHWSRTYPKKKKFFLVDYPINILAMATNDTWGGVPIMMGANNQDGLTFVTGQYIYNPGLKDQYFMNYTQSYPGNFGYGLSTEKVTEDSMDQITDKIRSFYYGSIPIEEMSSKTYHQTHIDMYSHRNYFQCVKNAAVLFARWSDVYLYYWSRGASTFKKWHDYLQLNLTKGLADGDEVHFLFDTADDYGDFMLIRNSRPKHLKFSKNMVKLWLRFAKTGKPTDGWTSMKGKGKGDLEWYELGDERQMSREPFTKFTDFWDGLGLDGRRDLPPPGNSTRKPPRKPKPSSADGFIYVDLDDTTP